MTGDEETEMVEVQVTCRWESVHVLVVPAGWTVPDTLDGFTEDQLEQLSSLTASLIDWQ